MNLESQDFLGLDAARNFAETTVGIVGAGGGGSHIAQQLAHLGVGRHILVDDDRIESRNLNRLVGGTRADVDAASLKVEIARRLILGVNPEASVLAIPQKWQLAIEHLRACDVIFGCVDSFRERDELEQFCRRFLIPYIDLGMEVTPLDAGGFAVSGQTVLSAPHGLCLRCLGIVTDERIAMQEQRYGVAGPRPQIVWTNGVLASLAVGLFTQMVNPWHPGREVSECLEFDGNGGRVETSRMDSLRSLTCQHFRDGEVGDPFFTTG